MRNLKGIQNISKTVSRKIVIGLYVLQIMLFQLMLYVTFPIIQENLGNFGMFDMMKQEFRFALSEQIRQQECHL